MFAQQSHKRGHAAVPSDRQIGAIHFDGRKMMKPHAAIVKDAAAPATGVVQLHYEEDKLFAFFVATAALPANSPIQLTITIDDGSGNPQAMTFDPVAFQTFNAGDFITLPSLDNMVDLNQSLLVTYTVDIGSGRTLTEANGTYLVGSSLGYSDLSNFAPVITGTTQKIAANKDMILVINGVFTSDAPLVVLESSVPPPGAITRVSSSEIDVDLSQVQGLDLSGLNEYLLTVSQATFADTVVYRFAPAPDGTYNQAPQ
jgi:hypothetical protein